MKKTLIFAAVFFLAFFISSQKVSAADWSISTIDSAGFEGLSLAVDTNNKAYISYYDNVNFDLKYATNASGSWVIEIADSTGNVGTAPSIAIDTNNKAHISYFDNETGYLKYATNASGVWVNTVVNSIDGAGHYASIDLDSNNAVYIGYYVFGDQDLKYATNASGAWVSTTLDSAGDVGYYTSLKVDTNNKAHISYYDATNQDLKYATNASGAWVYEIVYDVADTAAVSYPSLALDTNNKAHISFTYWNTTDSLKYTTNASGTWIDTTIDSPTDSVGIYSSLSLDANNKAHISYNDTANEDLKYITNNSGNWVSATLDSTGNVGRPSAIALDTNNKAHICYYDNTNAVLKYAYTPGPSVTSVLVNSGDEYTTSENINLTLSAQGNPTKMIISEQSDFSDASWEDYAVAKNFTLSLSEGTKTIYARFEDQWYVGSDAVSDTIRYIKDPKFVTKSATKTNEVLITEKNKKYLSRDLSLLFKLFPEKLTKTKYYLQSELSSGYSKFNKSSKKSDLKKYWQIDTNLNKYVAKDKYKLQLVFSYSDDEFNALQKKSKSIKESKLSLKYYNKASKTWKNAKSTHSFKKNTFTITLPSTTLPGSSYYFAIGVM